MSITNAKLEDAPIIVDYLFLAMDSIIYEFIGKCDIDLAKEFLHHFVTTPNNQYSYTNCWVAKTEEGIVGAIIIYNGADLNALRAPIISYIQLHYSPSFNPEAETEIGEFYIDSFGVKPSCQGQGVGTTMLQFIINEYAINKNLTLGLLVESENYKAKKLYLNLGFKIQGHKTLVGKKLEHLQYEH